MREIFFGLTSAYTISTNGDELFYGTLIKPRSGQCECYTDT